MSQFLLVHGSTQDAHCWDFLVPALEKCGHDVIRAKLPIDEPEAGSARYAEVIINSLPRQADDTIVVGHSASGYFLPLVAAQRKVRRIVFLAATLPRLGMSFLDQMRADPTIFRPDWVGKDPSKDDSAACQFLFHDCPANVAKWAMTIRIFLPLGRVANEIYPLNEWPNVDSSYIVCSEDRTINPEWSRCVARERLGTEPIEIASGHCPYLSKPGELADILSRFA